MTTMVNGNQSSFNFESDSLDLLTILEICLEFLVTIIGDILYLTICHYERFEGDPMKRSIVNKFISALCLTMASSSFWSASTLLLRVFYGPFPLVLAKFILLLIIYAVLFICMNVICVFILKILQIKAFYFVNDLNEDFWFLVTEIFNVTFCSILIIIQIVSGRPLPYAKALAGQPLWQTTASLNFVIPIVCILCLLVLVVWRVWHYFTNTDDSIQEPVPNGHFNNITHNPKVLKDLQLFGISSIVISSSFVPYFVTAGKAPTTADEIFLALMPMRLAVGIIIPTLFFIFNKNLKLYAQREFWQWAPDYLQQYNPTLYHVGDVHVEQIQQIEITHVVPVSSDQDQSGNVIEEEAETAL